MINRCPICHNEPTSPPNGVCGTCYQQLKSGEVHTLEQIAEAERALLEDFNPEADPEVLEGNIATRMEFEHTQWEQMTEKGLSAARLAIVVIDEAEHPADWQEWHQRRIAFMDDLIYHLPDSLFFPATRSQLNRYARLALDYWEGKLPEAAAKDTYRAFSKIIDLKTPPSARDLKSFPLWMLHNQDDFDWMWRQFLGRVYESVTQKDDLSEDEWVDLFWSHFPDTLIDWVTGRPAQCADE